MAVITKIPLHMAAEYFRFCKDAPGQFAPVNERARRLPDDVGKVRFEVSDRLLSISQGRIVKGVRIQFVKFFDEQ